MVTDADPASPDELDLVIVRGCAADTTGRAQHFAADPTRIGHLPAVLAERATNLTPSLDRLLDRHTAHRSPFRSEAISIVIPTADSSTTPGRRS